MFLRPDTKTVRSHSQLIQYAFQMLWGASVILHYGSDLLVLQGWYCVVANHRPCRGQSTDNCHGGTCCCESQWGPKGHWCQQNANERQDAPNQASDASTEVGDINITRGFLQVVHKQKESVCCTTANDSPHQELLLKYIKYITWTSYQIRKIADCACAGKAGKRFPCHRLQRKLLVSDPACMTSRASRTYRDACRDRKAAVGGGGGNVPGFPGVCATRNFTYLVWDPCRSKKIYQLEVIILFIGVVCVCGP